MKVFVSSVRRGLEEERDALRGMIMAIGHTPLAFEDFTSRSEPSREACTEGVAAADLYLLLIGPFYGHRFEDTGQSPTHDEWVAAQQAGIPRLVFLKEGVTLDEDQTDFYRSVSNYTSGVFYNTFASTPELLTKTVAAIREQAGSPSPLAYKQLPAPVPVFWRRDFDPNMQPHLGSSGTQLELHVIGQPPTQRSSRQISELTASLAGRVRSAGIVDDSLPLQVTQAEDGALLVATPAGRPVGIGGASRAVLSGVRVAPDGQASVWGTLPGDTMGSVVDLDDVTQQLAGMLRLVGQLRVIASPDLAVAVGVDDISMLTVGRVADLPRHSASFPSTSSAPVRVPPDELVTAAALDIAAAEAARPLANALTDAVRRRR